MSCLRGDSHLWRPAYRQGTGHFNETLRFYQFGFLKYSSEITRDLIINFTSFDDPCFNKIVLKYKLHFYQHFQMPLMGISHNFIQK